MKELQDSKCFSIHSYLKRERKVADGVCTRTSRRWPALSRLHHEFTAVNYFIVNCSEPERWEAAVINRLNGRFCLTLIAFFPFPSLSQLGWMRALLQRRHYFLQRSCWLWMQTQFEDVCLVKDTFVKSCFQNQDTFNYKNKQQWNVLSHKRHDKQSLLQMRAE